MSKKTLLIIAGPTAIGKTELAIKLANFFSTEIVSADSRQFFREMSIGTAKPTPDELSKAKHHFVDFLPIDHFFSSGDFEKAALRKLEEIFEQHDVAILTGGSGLYIKAVSDGLDSFPDIPEDIRARLNLTLENEGLAVLAEQLQRLDPKYYAEVDLSNPQRVIRALEVSLHTGVPYSSFRSGSSAKRPFEIIKIALELPREELYNRINQRVDQMIESGLLEEVRALVPKKHLNSLQTVGYKELFDYFDGNCTLGVAVEQIKMNTRRYAKRQLTWFRKDPEYQWFSPAEWDKITAYICAAL